MDCLRGKLPRGSAAILMKQIFKKTRLLITSKPKLITTGLNGGGAGMGDGVLLQEVVKQLGSFASTKLAEKWDNVGLLVEPTGCHRVKKMLLTNDLTQDVLAEAMEKSVEMIISYHPPIFVPLKRLSQGNWKERIILKCVENRIAVYSPHTSHDAVKGGVNDWLIGCFGQGDVQPIMQSFESSFSRSRPNSCYKVRLTSDQGICDVESAIKQVESMQEVLNAKFFKDPTSDGTVVEMIVIPSEVGLAKIVGHAEGLFNPSISEISKLENLPLPGYGMGRTVQLKEKITIEDAIARVKKHLEIPHLRLALARKTTLSKKISKVAVCAGSGGGVLKGVDADLYVTGELSHHEVLHAAESGRSVILCEHSNSERGFLKTLAPLMKTSLNGEVAIEVSSKDKDPLFVV